MELLGVFVARPWSALVVAGLMLVLWRWSRSKLAVAAALAWAAYAGYEYLMFARVLCTGECDIRVDLLLIYPLLLLLSVVAGAHSMIRGRSARRRAT